jgi:gluconate 2-dehydrogenase gamma chain
MALDRRTFFLTVGGAWLAAPVAELRAAADYAVRAARKEADPTLSALTPAEAATIEALTAQIIPTDDTPGAREAGAVYFIDRMLGAARKADLPLVRRGLADLRKRAANAHPGATLFESLTADEQHAVLVALEKEKSDFFDLIREATIVATFSSPEHGGNRGKVGWSLIGFEDRFVWTPPFGHYDRES